MPNEDGTGPEGKGSKTGRQQGKCKESNPTNNNSNQENRPRRRGIGLGRGMGLGRRNRTDNE
ncbi:MAG: DUF5320 domain-containing protein [Nanoarchaeota archaeon]|nr:DUF5320 domain-containing protein [Nanoarchaeota archaeon]